MSRGGNISGGSSRVLIETYWNVNFAGLGIIIPPAGVLIETYWNVNEESVREHIHEENVLIETYWNVNIFNCFIYFWRCVY